MRRINLLLQRPERKKYRKLRRWETLYGQTYGPKLVAQNFALEPWSLALGGYFTRHGQRSGATRAAARLLRQLYQELRGLRGTHRWVLQLAEGTTQSHQRPEFLYSHLKQRFPAKNLERERRWIRRLRRRALLGERRRQRRERRQRQQQAADATARRHLEEEPSSEARLWVRPYGGLFNLSSVTQLPRLALLRHRQLQLWWDTPRPLLTAARYLQLRQRRWRLDRGCGPLLRPLRSSGRRLQRRRTAEARAAQRRRTGATPRRAFRRWRRALRAWGRRRPLPTSQRRRKTLAQRLAQLDPRQKRRLLVRLPALLAYGRRHRRQRHLNWSYPAVAHRLPRWLRGALGRRLRRRAAAPGRRLARRVASAQRRATTALGQLRRLARRAQPRRLLRSLAVGLGALGRLRRGLAQQNPGRRGWGVLRRRRAQLLLVWLRRRRRTLAAALLLRRAQRRQREALLRRCLREADRCHRRLERLSRERRRSGGAAAAPEGVADRLEKSWQKLQRTTALVDLQASRAQRRATDGDGRWRLNRRRLGRLLRRLRPSAGAAPQPRPTATASGPARKPLPTLRRTTLAAQRRRRHRHWRLPSPLQRQYPAFNPLQWRKLTDNRWRTLQAQQPDSLAFCWEKPLSRQLGRWRRGGSEPASAALGSHLRRRLRPRRRLRRRVLSFRPQIHYRIRELHLQDLELLEEQLAEEGEDAVLDPGQRYLLVTRRYGAVGYGPLLRDCFSLLTPQLRLRSQVVGHKSARRTIYQARAGVSLAVRVRTLFGWLRELVIKNEDYNLLRRNTARKPNSKRIRDKPERGRRCTQPFYPRLATELRRLMGADEPLLQQLALFDARSAPLRVPRRHYRWEN